MADQVNFDALAKRYEEKADKAYEMSDEELREVLELYPKGVPPAYAKIGPDDFFD